MRDSVRGPHGRSGVRGKFLSRGHCSGHRGAERELSLGGKKGAEEVSTGGLQGDGGGCFGEVCVCVRAPFQSAGSESNTPRCRFGRVLGELATAEQKGEGGG